MASKNVGDIILGIVAQLEGFNKANEELKKLKGQLEDTAKTMAKFSAVVGGSVGLAVKSTLDYTEKIDKLNKLTGISTETIQKLGYAAEQEGVSLDSLANGLKFFQQSLSQAKAGQESSIGAFRRLGINANDSAFQMLSLEDKVKIVSDAFVKMTDDSEKTTLAMEIFGKSGFELKTFLQEGSNEMGRLGDEAVRIGKVLEDSLIKKGEKVGDEFNKASNAFKSATIRLGAEMLPVLSDASNAFTDLVSGIKNLSGVAYLIQSTLVPAILTMGATKAVSGILSLTKSIGGAGGLSEAFKSAAFSSGNLSLSIGLASKGMYDLGRMIYYGAKAWDAYRKSKEAAAVQSGVEDKLLDNPEYKEMIPFLSGDVMDIGKIKSFSQEWQQLVIALNSVDSSKLESMGFNPSIVYNAANLFLSYKNEIKKAQKEQEKLNETTKTLYDVNYAMLSLEEQRTKIMQYQSNVRSNQHQELVDWYDGYQEAEVKSLDFGKQIISATDAWRMSLEGVDIAMQSILDKSMTTNEKWKSIVASLLPMIGMIIGTAINPLIGGTIGAGVGQIGSTVINSFDTGNMAQMPININVTSPVFSDTDAVEMTFRRAVRKGITLSNAGAINV